MKILLLHDLGADKQNGVSVSLGILTKELEKKGYDIRVLTLADGTKSYKDGNEYRLSSVPAFIYPGIRMRPPLRHRFIEELVAWKPDVIHTNCEFSTFMTAKHIHSHCAVTPAWIHTFHTDYKYYIGVLQKIHTIRDKAVPRFLDHCFKMCDALIVPTEKMYHYIKDGNFSPSIHTEIIPTGIDFSELEKQAPVPPAQTKAALGLAADAKIVLFLGRISAEKNLEELVTHFAAYSETHSNVYLVTVGDGPYKETLQRLVKKMGIESRTVVHDGVKHTDIRRFYDAADVFASASESETQGLTFYEALYCGVPVLAKDKECLEQAVTEGENGAFFSNAAEFESALDALLALREKNGGKLHSVLSEDFESAHFAENVAALYERAVRSRRERRRSSFRKMIDEAEALGKKLRFKAKQTVSRYNRHK